MYKTLIDTGTLARHIADPRWVIVDCRFTLTDPAAGRRAYGPGHIVARYAHLNEDLSRTDHAAHGRHPLPDPNALAAEVGRLGHR